MSEILEPREEHQVDHSGAENWRYKNNWRDKSKNKHQGPSFSSPIIEIIVGKEWFSFHVHESFLKHYSPYFRNLLQSGTKESRTRLVELGNTSPEAFQTCVEFMYSDGDSTRSLNPPPFRQKNWARQHMAFMRHMAELWVLAEFLDMPKLRDMAAEAMLQRDDVGMIPSSIFRYAYSNTQPDSGLREICIQMLLKMDFRPFGVEYFLAKNGEDLPEEMLISLFEVLRMHGAERQ